MCDIMTDSPSVQHNGIQAIDKTSVHRICSGQVVLNLATAVKELVENSIDASASSVEVRLKDYGKELVEVVDNGRGVREENFAGLTLKHHTSKLKEFSDLVSVDTFGFRGEALSSLCALSKMTIVTCHESADIGTKLEYDSQGKIVKQIPFPRQKGTTVSLQNLFCTLPVRHKEFIRNLKREFSKAIQVLNAYCIISTGVRITCTNQIGKGKKTIVVSTEGNPTVIENITNIFGAKQAQTLLDFIQYLPKEDICTEFGISEQQMKKDLFHISGYVSSSEHGLGRSTTDRQFYFINKRPCDAQKISRLVNDVYHMYNRHQYPFVVLDISLAKDSVDMNVTPDKRQIFIQEEKLLLAMLKSSLIKLFEPRSALYKVSDGITKKKSGDPGEWSFKKSPSKSQMSSPASKNQKSGSLAGSLKRRFSSVYAKSIEETNSNVEPKQRKLDSFVVFKPASEETVNKDLQSSDCSAAEPSMGISAIDEASAVNNNDSYLQTTSLQNINISDLKSVVCLDAAENIVLQTQDAENACDKQQVDICTEVQIPSTNVDNKPEDFTENDISYKVHSANCEYDGDKHKGVMAAFTSNKLTNFATFSDKSTTSSPRRSLAILQTSSSPVRKSLQQFLRKQTPGSEVTDMSSIRTNPYSNERQPSQKSQNFVCDTSSAESDSVSSKETTSLDCTRLTDSAEKDLTEYMEPHQSLTITFTEYDVAKELSRKEKRIDFSMDKLKKSLQNRQANCEAAKRCQNFRARIKPTDNQAAEEELKKEISKDMFSKMDILGQFNLGFIVTCLGRDLFIIDQHASDEKHNFEQLQKHTIIQSQKLIQPQRLELTAANESILIDNLEIFHSNGFDFVIDEEAPPTQRVYLATMPISKNWTFGKEDIEELIFMLTDSPGVMCRPSRIRQMFASRACRKSVMIGTALNKVEMKKLVCQMGELDQPWNCPHGRPTMRHLINLDLLPD